MPSLLTLLGALADEADQDDVDTLCGLLRTPASSPKGFSPSTMALVREAVRAAAPDISAAEVNLADPPGGEGSDRVELRCGQNGGVAGSGTVGVDVEDYDAAHAAVHGSSLMRRLWSAAMGDQYPAEVDPFSSCTWWLLGHLVAALRLPAGGLLVDLGCGRGGPGLWLARALSARLIGIDFSPVAVALAAQRARGFVGSGRAEFRRATFDRTGLPDASVDGAVSVDALPFATDRVAALREAGRILVPGGRLALTVRVQPGGPGDWPAMAACVGLDVEYSMVNRDHDEFWRRLHASWLTHESELRAELGDRAADNLIVEARQALERSEDLPPHELLVLRRPERVGASVLAAEDRA